jgi:ribosomal protein L17
MEFDTAPSAAVLMTPEEVIAVAYAKAREKRDAAETAVAANANGDFRQSRFSAAQVRDDALKPKPTTAAGRLIKAANNSLERRRPRRKTKTSL